MSSEFVNSEIMAANSQSSEWAIDQTIHCARFRVEKAARLGKFFILKSAADPMDLIAISLLHKEFDLTYRLDHPSIRRALSIERIESRGEVLVLDYIDGRPLDAVDVLALPKMIRHKILTDLLDAIGYLHARQTIHRDLKPQNILITYNGCNVKLIDLSFSDADDHSALKSPAGTLDYMAPEQRRGDLLNVRADIYSLGVIFERCFSDIVPRSIYCRCLNEDPSKRYGSITEVIAAIEAYARRTKLWRWLSLTLIIVGMLIGVWLAWRLTLPADPRDAIAPATDTVKIAIPVPALDTAVPKESLKSKKLKTPIKTDLGYVAVLPYPNAVEGYSIKQLGAIAHQTMLEINKILDQDMERFDSPQAIKERLISIAEKHFAGIPHTMQKQLVLDTIDSISQSSRYLNKNEKNSTQDSIAQIN